MFSEKSFYLKKVKNKKGQAHLLTCTNNFPSFILSDFTLLKSKKVPNEWLLS